MAAVSTKESAGTVENRIDSAVIDDSANKAKRERIIGKYREYMRVTFEVTGAASAAQTEQLRSWVMSETDVDALEKWYNADYKNKMESAVQLHGEFMRNLAEAESKGLLGGGSKAKWVKRFRDPGVPYKQKEYWVQHQMKSYIRSWESVARERDAIMSNPKFKLIDPKMAGIAKIVDKAAFLNMHFNERKGVLAKARSAMQSVEKGNGDLYMRAKSMLYKAVSKRVLAPHKVGIWLERTFGSNAPRAKIEAFLDGSGANSLGVLIGKWDQVKTRYNRVMEKVQQRGKNHARGWYPVSEAQFLSMHYTQRLRYVEESEDRLNGANDIAKELPIFIRIRHAIDTKDWEEADAQISLARGMEMSPENRERLRSMRSYVTQFRTDKQRGKKAPGEGLREAKDQIDSILPLIPQSMRGLVLRGLYSSQSNRFIHQLRWIIYNNKWCRDKGYLTQKRASQFKDKQSKEQTHKAGKEGGDTGMHDVLNSKNEGSKFIRKEEYSKNRPTYRHVDIGSGGVVSTMGEWLEKEQHPRVLYWTTFCANDGQTAMSESWHNDLFHNLTALRSATRKIENSGFKYGGPGKPLVGKN